MAQQTKPWRHLPIVSWTPSRRHGVFRRCVAGVADAIARLRRSRRALRWRRPEPPPIRWEM